MPKTRTRPQQSKAAFVRAHSALKPQAILKRAKAAGVPLTIAYIYNVRGAANAKTKKAGAASRSRPRSERAGGLKQTVERMAQELADRILAQLRNVSLAELLGK